MQIISYITLAHIMTHTYIYMYITSMICIPYVLLPEFSNNHNVHQHDHKYFILYSYHVLSMSYIDHILLTLCCICCSNMYIYFFYGLYVSYISYRILYANDIL